MPKPGKPVPEGYHTVTPYLTVKNAAEALEFYERAFGATHVLRMAGPDGKSTMHAEFKIGDSMVMLADEWQQGAKAPASIGGTTIGIFLYVEDVDALFKRAVAAGATVTMPPTDMFWGDRYSKLTDPFGHHWSIATHKFDMTEEELAQGQKEFMAKMGQG